MITTVKNTRGYQISLANFIISLACTVCIFYLGYTKNLKAKWFGQLGFVTSFITLLHQALLLFKRKAYTRISILHRLAIFGYILSFLACIIVPLFVTSEYKDMDAGLKPFAVYFFITCGFNLVPLYILALALVYRNSQRIQNLLHPFNEIIDGFRKSSGSIQMTSIPSSNVTLKQVVIDDGKSIKDSAEFNSTVDLVESNSVSVTAENNITELQESRESVLPASHKADGSSPKPSKVLKTWPKADPFPVRALYSFKPTSSSELPFKKGDTITVLDCRGRWWQAQKDDRIGFIPSNYVTVLLKARVISSFTAIEDDQVSVKKDEIIEVMEKYEEKCLVRNVEDKIGAVPTEKLEFPAE